MERLRGAEEWDKRAKMLAAQSLRSKPGIFHYFCGGTFSSPNDPSASFGDHAAHGRRIHAQRADSYGNSFRPSCFKKALCFSLAAAIAC